MQDTRAYVWMVRALLLAAIVYGGTQVAAIGGGGRQHDFKTYYYAAKAYEKGRDPYDLGRIRKMAADPELKPFIYPPHTLVLFRPLSRLGYRPAYALFFAAKIAALLALVFIWMRIVPVSRRDGWALCVTVLLGCQSAVLRDLRAGNVSLFEQFFLWGGILLILRNRRWGGGVSILLSAAFKLVTVALAPVVVILRRSWASLGLLGVLLLLAVAGGLLLRAAQPDLWDRFIAGARALDERGNKAPGALALIFDLRDALALRPSAAYVIYGVWCAAVLGAAAWAFRLTRRFADPRPMLYVFLLAYALTAPRRKDYSYILVLLPALHVLSVMAKGRLAALAGCALLWIPMVPYQSFGVAAAAFGLALNWIRAHRGTPDDLMPQTLDPLRVFREARPAPAGLRGRAESSPA